MSEKCEQCGNKAEPEMVAFAKEHKQSILCKGCDKYFSEFDNHTKPEPVKQVAKNE